MLRQGLRCAAVVDDDGCQTRSYRALVGGSNAPMNQKSGKKIPMMNITRAYSLGTTSAMTSPISDGLRAMWHPASSSASIFAAAVPLLPEMIAPA